MSDVHTQAPVPSDQLDMAKGKHNINTVRFLTQTKRFVSLCMLFEVGSIDLHYMSDKQQRFDRKISKLKILWKQRHLHLGCP